MKNVLTHNIIIPFEVLEETLIEIFKKLEEKLYHKCCQKDM